jgi:hypothetical protein
MKLKRMLKVLSWLSAALLLSLATRFAISAANGIDFSSGSYGLANSLRWLFDGWQGSSAISFIAVMCVILAIAGRGIARH